MFLQTSLNGTDSGLHSISYLDKYRQSMDTHIFIERTWIPASILCAVSVIYLFINYIYWLFAVVSVLYMIWINIPKNEIIPVANPTGKFVLITGCDTGIGRKFAVYAHALGFEVFACCYENDSEGAEALIRIGEPRMHVLKMDVTQDEDVNSVMNYVSKYCKHDGLWAVVNAIDVAGCGQIELCSVDNYQSICDINLIGTVRVTKAFLHLVRRARGRIINMSSERGLISMRTASSYCMSKYGIEAFTDCLRGEMKPFGVQVSLIEVEERPSHGQFYAASKDIQRAYPWDDVNNLVKSKYESIDHSRLLPSEVVDVLHCQLIRSKILPRYIVLGDDIKLLDVRYRIILYLKKYLSNMSFGEWFSLTQ